MLREFAIGLIMCAAPMVAADPFSGTWILNAAKSSGTIPKGESVAIEERDRQLEVTIAIVDSRVGDGVLKIRYRVSARGGMGRVEEGPYEGVEIRRVNQRTLETTYIAGGRKVRFTRAVVAKDGRTMTSTGSAAAAGDWVMVFDRR